MIRSHNSIRLHLTWARLICRSRSDIYRVDFQPGYNIWTKTKSTSDCAICIPSWARLWNKFKLVYNKKGQSKKTQSLTFIVWTIGLLSLCFQKHVLLHAVVFHNLRSFFVVTFDSELRTINWVDVFWLCFWGCNRNLSSRSFTFRLQENILESWVTIPI